MRDRCCVRLTLGSMSMTSKTEGNKISKEVTGVSKESSDLLHLDASFLWVNLRGPSGVMEMGQM